MSLKDKIVAAKFAYRDVPICLDGSLVVERESALAELAAASTALAAANVELRRYEEPETGDTRLGQKPAGLLDIEERIKTAAESAETASAKVADIESRMRDSEVTFRFTALPKDQFVAAQLAAKGDSQHLYSTLARTTSQYLNEGVPEPIDAEIWDLLEPTMTAGQWTLIVDALDQINIIEGKRGLAFLRKGSAKTLN